MFPGHSRSHISCGRKRVQSHSFGKVLTNKAPTFINFLFPVFYFTIIISGWCYHLGKLTEASANLLWKSNSIVQATGIPIEKINLSEEFTIQIYKTVKEMILCE